MGEEGEEERREIIFLGPYKHSQHLYVRIFTLLCSYFPELSQGSVRGSPFRRRQLEPRFSPTRHVRRSFGLVSFVLPIARSVLVAKQYHAH